MNSGTYKWTLQKSVPIYVDLKSEPKLDNARRGYTAIVIKIS